MIAEKVAYLDGLPIGIQACQVSDYPPHWHDDEIEILYIQEGTVNIIVSFDSYIATKGDFVLINQGEIHHIHAEGGESTVLSLYIRLDAFTASFPYIQFIYFCWQSFNLSKQQVKDSRMLEKLIFRLFIEITVSTVYESSRIMQYVVKIIDVLINHFDIIHTFNQNAITKEQLSKYHHIIRFIEENYAGKISMSDLASEEHMGRNYVSQFWKKVTEMNFTEFLNCRRVELAEKLILTTDLSLQSISLQCGFSDPKYFYKYFKKWYSCTPKEHRQKYDGYEKINAVFAYLELSEFREVFDRLLTDCYAQEASTEEQSRENPAEHHRRAAGKIREYLTTRLKRELTKENLKRHGVKNLYVGLFSSGVVEKTEKEYLFNWSILDDTIKLANDLDLRVTIGIDLTRRNDQGEWEQVLKKLSRRIKSKANAEPLRRIKYIVYLDELQKASDIKTAMSKYISPSDMELTFKF